MVHTARAHAEVRDLQEPAGAVAAERAGIFGGADLRRRASAARRSGPNQVSLIAGTSNNTFQIPNNPGQPIGQAPPSAVPVTSAFGVTSFNSALLNENQREFTQFGVFSVQKSYEDFNGQLSYFTRYNNLHFVPDPIGDLLLNGIASDITRRSYTNGIQGDASYQVNPAHTLRAGFTISGEQVFVGKRLGQEVCRPHPGFHRAEELTAASKAVISSVSLFVRKLLDFDNPPSAVTKPSFSAHSSKASKKGDGGGYSDFEAINNATKRRDHPF
jgi:hypothetical protein